MKLDPKDDAALFHRGVAWSRKGDYEAALKNFDASIKLDATYAPAYLFRGQARFAKQEYDKALADYERECAAATPRCPRAGAKAWLLATCPVQKYRQGKTAVELATKACKMTKWKDTENLDTLSCACAEAGQFAEAVKWQNKVLADPDISKEAGTAARAKLKLFEQKKAYRDDAK